MTGIWKPSAIWGSSLKPFNLRTENEIIFPSHFPFRNPQAEVGCIVCPLDLIALQNENKFEKILLGSIDMSKIYGSRLNHLWLHFVKQSLACGSFHFLVLIWTAIFGQAIPLECLLSLDIMDKVGRIKANPGGQHKLFKPNLWKQRKPSC